MMDMSQNVKTFGMVSNSNSSQNDTSVLFTDEEVVHITAGWHMVFVVLRIFAILTNLSFVVAVYGDRTSKAGPRLLIGNLALWGFFLSVGLFPLMTVREWMPPGFIASPCSIVSATFFFATIVSWADVCLAANRTTAICFPFYYDAFRQPKVTWVLILSSWCISITIAVLVETEVGLSFVKLGKTFCAVKVTSLFGKFYTGLSTLIPYGIIGMASFAIFITAYIKLRHSQSDVVAGARVKRLLKRRLVIAKAMLASLLWSVTCTLPTLVLISVPGPAEVVWRNSSFGVLTTISAALLYCVNPLIYFWISSSYRRCFLHAVCYRSATRPLQVEPSGNDRVLQSQKTPSGTRNTTV